MHMQSVANILTAPLSKKVWKSADKLQS